jgi:hypothetical protein
MGNPLKKLLGMALATSVIAGPLTGLTGAALA